MKYYIWRIWIWFFGTETSHSQIRLIWRNIKVRFYRFIEETAQKVEDWAYKKRYQAW